MLGLDYASVLALAESLGYDTHAMAEFLPAIEAGMAAALNERLSPP